MADFLLELWSEEIPARMQAKARADLARLFAEKLAAAGLEVPPVETFSTPRRLALIARGLPAATAAVAEERRGPKADAPAQAIEGFLKSTGLSRDQVEEREDPKGRFLYAVIERPGRATTAVLVEVVEAIVRDLPWPKSMRWGAASLSTASPRWVRPLQGIIAMLDAEVIAVEAAGIRSGCVTAGHRTLHQGPITIGGADDYAVKLRAGHVILDHEERARIIRDGARAAAVDAGLTLVDDEGLVEENAGLTEWPVPLLGDFDQSFLAVPREVIQLTMRTNQKYFAASRADGGLAPAFVCVANIVASDGGKAIVAGNRKVLAARLSDAKFFWEQDLKTPLAAQAEKLSQITFHEKLGTVADKVERVAKLARWLAEQGIVKGADPEQAEQAARLAKADLVTGMVGEFPELQGVMGGYYARAEGLPGAVADAIRDHYGTNPKTPVATALSLADKLDTLIAFFSIDEKPTGSKDPFALRRAGLGAMFIILSKHLRIDLQKIAPRDVIDFLIDRWKFQNRAAGGRVDLIDAVVAATNDADLSRLGSRMRALETFIATDDGANLLAGYKRAANILRIEEKKDGAAATAQALSYAPEPAEAALVAALAAAGPRAEAAVVAEDFEGAMAALASLRAPIDDFFEAVTVNDADPQKRAARLGMLAQVRDAVHRVADFSRIEG